MWLVKASLKYPHAVVVLALIILLLGVLAGSSIPVDILPAFKAPAVEVLTYFQGMPASSIEKTITNRIERWVGQAPGAQVVESKSVPGVSVVKVYFRDDIDSNEALTLTTSLAQGTLPTLPPNTLPPVTLKFDPTGTLPLGILTVTNPTMDEAHLKDVARIDVRNMLGAVPGCVAPVVVGGKDRTVLVYLDQKALDSRNLSPLDVVHALQKGNRMVTPGTAYFGSNLMLLDTNVMVENVSDLNELPVTTQQGRQVYLKDIGRAQDAYTIQTSRVRINGRRQVYVPIYRQQGASSLAVAGDVKDYIDSMQKRLPPGTKLSFVMDQSVYVKESIRSLIHEGIIGAILVSVMILIFLGNWRMTVIACLSMLLAIFWSITCLRATGNTINAMTLGGLALAIGPLVDTAIVVLENTHRHQSLGKSRFKAALDGAAEVTVPVLIATLATIIVLCPIARMPGMGGFLFMPLTLALACAMLAAFVLSQTLVPMLCSKWLGTGTHVGAEHASEGLGGGIHARIEYALSCLTRQYGRVLAWALRHRGPVLVGVGLLFLASLGLAGGIGREFFPQVDAGMITLYVRAPSNMRLDAAEKRIAQVERFLEQHVPENERQMIVTELGLDPDWSAAYTANAGQQDAAIRLQLSDERSRSAQEYAIYLRDLLGHDRRFNDLRISFDTGGMVSAALNYGASSPIDVQIAGGSFDQAMDLAKEIKNRVTWDEASQKGVRGTADVHVQQRLDAPYLVFEVDRKKAANEGLSAEDVILQVVAAMNSSVSINRNFWIDNKSGNQYFVAVQYPENKNITLDDVLNIDATGTDQAHTVKLRQLVHIKHRSDAVEINHTSLYRTVDVLINTAGRDIGGVAGDINKRLAGLQPEIDKKVRLLERQHAVLLNGKRPETKAQLLDLEQEINGLKSLRWELRGEYQRMNESWGSLFWGAVIAVFLVYLLMVPLFRSYLGPLIILITVPLGLIGVLTMLYVTHTTLNVQSEMGVIFLVGIVVSNGVLLMDFANKQRRLGADVHKAITTAAAIRFRPIMMTFLATSLDLIPMAIGLGRGSEANVPLARAVVGGLLTSTFLTLIVVPILFTLLMGQGKEAEFDIDAELADAPVLTPVVAHALPGHTPEGFPAVVGAPTNHQADEDGFGERPG